MSFDRAAGAKLVFIRNEQALKKMCQKIIHADELIVF